MICTLEDQHLINIIRYYAKKINACTEILAVEDSLNFQIMSAFNPRYSVKSQRDEAVKRLVALTDKLSDYVMEAVIRKLGNEISEYLQMAYGRSSGINYSMKQLPSAEIDDDYDEDTIQTHPEWKDVPWKEEEI